MKINEQVRPILSYLVSPHSFVKVVNPKLKLYGHVGQVLSMIYKDKLPISCIVAFNKGRGTRKVLYKNIEALSIYLFSEGVNSGDLPR